LFPASPVAAQTAPKKTAEQVQAAYNSHKGDFDYLLGDWTFTAKSREFGMFEGRWSAVRLGTGQILDEYRIVGNGETIYVTTTIRNFNGVADRWELIGMDQANGLQDFGTAQRVGKEMRIEQRFGVAGGNPVVMRIRYHHIEAGKFSWAADRSTDGGKTWVTDFQTIEATRVGPARSLPALTKP
jgi:hypothetical protein